MKKFFPLLLCAALLCTCGCSAGYINETQGDPVAPLQDSSGSEPTSLMPLYFRYYDEPMLIRSAISVEVSSQHPVEYYAITALLAGPSGQRPELTGCFGQNTKLLDIDSNKEYLYVTLSDGFLLDTEGSSAEETRKNRQIAIYSIVNTVCELGNFSQVQIYLRINGAAQRPDSFEMGFGQTNNDSSPLGPLTRSTEYILTPSNAVKMALEHYSALEWNKLYYYLGDKDGATVTLPLLEEMTKQFEYMNLIMTDFSADKNYTISDDGKTAIVQVSFKIRTQNANYIISGAPLELVYKRRCWLISYESFMRYLEVNA